MKLGMRPCFDREEREDVVWVWQEEGLRSAGRGDREVEEVEDEAQLLSARTSKDTKELGWVGERIALSAA